MAQARKKPASDLAVHAYRWLERATQAVSSLSDRALDSFGLTHIQYRVLEILLYEGPMTQAKLGQKLARGDSNMHFVASQLEKHGLTIRRINTEDARSTRVHLTPQGQALAKQVCPQQSRLIRARMSALKLREQETLLRLCQRLAQGDAVKFVLEITQGE
jgi:DNA-binding MarR family transcriptional regulator